MIIFRFDGTEISSQFLFHLGKRKTKFTVNDASGNVFLQGKFSVKED